MTYPERYERSWKEKGDNDLNETLPYTESQGFRELQRKYAEKLSQGFKWASNFGAGEKSIRILEEEIKRHTSRGIECFVGDVAFRPNGEVEPGGKVLLIR